MKYLSYNKIKDILDEIFNKEGYDYYYANKLWSELKLRSTIDKELKSDKNLSINKFPGRYYKNLFLPSQKDIEKALKDENLSEGKKKLLSKLLSEGVLDAVAYITKAINEKDGKKNLVYMVAINSSYIPELTKYKDLKGNEKKDFLKAAGYFLSGLWYHEALGHGKLGHLESNYFENHTLDNIFEDLVINTRIEKYLPKAGEAIRNLGGIFHDTQYQFPDVKMLFLKMEGMLNYKKYDLPEKAKIKDLNQFKKDIKKLVDEIEKNLKFAFSVTEESFIPRNFPELERMRNVEEKFVEDLGKFISNLMLKSKTEGKVNFNYIDKIILNNIPKFVETFKKHNPEAQEKIKSDVQILGNKNFLSFTLDEIFDIGRPIQDEENKGTGDGKGKGKKSNKGGSNGTIENGDINKLSDVLDEIDDLKDEIDDIEARNQENVLKEINEKMEEEFSNTGKSVRPGTGTGSKEMELKKLDVSLEDLEKILSKFMKMKILNDFGEPDFKKPGLIPSVNLDVLRQQVLHGNGSLGVPFGMMGKKEFPVKPNNFLYTIHDVSGSMSERVISASKSAIVNTACSRKDVVVSDIVQDYGYQGSVVLNPNSKNYDENLKEFFKAKGGGGTGNFGNAIFTISHFRSLAEIFNNKGRIDFSDIKKISKLNNIADLNLDIEDINRMVADLNKKYKKELGQDYLGNFQDISADNNHIKFLFVTDTDITYDRSLINLLKQGKEKGILPENFITFMVRKGDMEKLKEKFKEFEGIVNIIKIPS